MHWHARPEKVNNWCHPSVWGLLKIGPTDRQPQMAFQMFRYNLLLLHCNYAPCVWYSSIIIIQYITQILHLPYKLNPLIIMMQILASSKVAMPLFSDFCVNRQPRAAYRCNMDTKVGFLKPSNQVLCAKTNGNFISVREPTVFGWAPLATSGMTLWQVAFTNLEDYFPKFVVQTLSFRNSSQDSQAGHC